MVPEFSDTNWEAETFDEENISESAPDLPPEYCHYRDEGCDLAESCLDCPFPQCIYEQPRGRQSWLKKQRDREMVRLFNNEGKEVSSGQTFSLEAYEHTSSGGKASLILHSQDGWTAITTWRARYQFRWNKTSNQMSVKDILTFVLARAGLKLEVKSQSSVITSFYPDFTIGPNHSGEMVIQKLLFFVPDVLFIEGSRAYIVNPLSSDSSVYSYGVEHQILDGRYRQGAWELNRVQVEGYDTGSDEPIVVDSFAWGEIDRLYDRLRQLEDMNIDTVAGAQQRGEAYLREAEIESADGTILALVNCGQQLYDVMDITDTRAGLTSEKKRVLGLTLVYSPRRGEYSQRLWLGAV